MQIMELDRMTLITFVKRIDVYEDKRIHVELRHKELFSKVIMLADYVENADFHRNSKISILNAKY